MRIQGYSKMKSSNMKSSKLMSSKLMFSKLMSSNMKSSKMKSSKVYSPRCNPTILFTYSVLQCCSELQYVVMCCNVLLCVAVCCNVLQSIASIHLHVSIYSQEPIQRCFLKELIQRVYSKSPFIYKSLFKTLTQRAYSIRTRNLGNSVTWLFQNQEPIQRVHFCVHLCVHLCAHFWI